MLAQSKHAITRDRYDAVLCDLDGVLTNTARLHATCWKQMLDEYLKERAGKRAEAFVPFDIDSDYRFYVDGKPRFDGVRDFLKSRGVHLPEGSPDDPPQAETVGGLGNRKNNLVNRAIEEAVDLPVPGRKYTFGVVKAAQARGDFEVLAQRDRRALRVHLDADVAAGLEKVRIALLSALGCDRETA
jgi:beta-phosphoglucomutase-like phosphatase (HAD superfamily)